MILNCGRKPGQPEREFPWASSSDQGSYCCEAAVLSNKRQCHLSSKICVEMSEFWFELSFSFSSGTWFLSEGIILGRSAASLKYCICDGGGTSRCTLNKKNCHQTYQNMAGRRQRRRKARDIKVGGRERAGEVENNAEVDERAGKTRERRRATTAGWWELKSEWQIYWRKLKRGVWQRSAERETILGGLRGRRSERVGGEGRKQTVNILSLECRLLVWADR